MQKTISNTNKSIKIGNTIKMSCPIENTRLSVCYAENDCTVKPSLSKSFLSQLITNQHPVMLCWLAISFILICSMYLYTSLTL